MNTATADTSARWVPRLVTAGLRRVDQQRARALGLTLTNDESNARRADRLAELYQREARWWRVLAAHVARDTLLALVYAQAADRAAEAADRRALTWRELAGDYRRSAAGEHVCPVIGCGCAGVCGVSA